MMDLSITAPAALAKAADLIEARGLAHGDYEDVAGRLCVMGALRTALFGDVDFPGGGVWDGGAPWALTLCNATVLVEEWLLEQDVPEAERSVPVWSDGSTQEQVVAVLRTIAAREVADDE